MQAVPLVAGVDFDADFPGRRQGNLATVAAVRRRDHARRTVEYQCPLLKTLTRSVKVTGKVKFNDAVDYVGAGSYVDQTTGKSAS